MRTVLQWLCMEVVLSFSFLGGSQDPTEQNPEHLGLSSYLTLLWERVELDTSWGPLQPELFCNPTNFWETAASGVSFINHKVAHPHSPFLLCLQHTLNIYPEQNNVLSCVILPKSHFHLSQNQSEVRPDWKKSFQNQFSLKVSCQGFYSAFFLFPPLHGKGLKDLKRIFI